MGNIIKRDETVRFCCLYRKKNYAEHILSNFISVLVLLLFGCKDPVSIRYSLTLELQAGEKI